jgi:tetratricopeptide (TPR) repeat protein
VAIISDERNAPSIDALDAHCHNLLYEMLLNDRRPVAIVGSGMSMVYGGVSWEISVKLALNYAVELIEGCKQKMRGQIDLASKLAAMEQDQIALKAFHGDEEALKSSNHKYVALDLCERALDRVDALEGRYRPKCSMVDDRAEGVSSFRAFMSKVYRDDTFYITELIRQRFHADQLKDELRSLSPQAVQYLAISIYSREFIADLIKPYKSLSRLFEIFIADLDRPLQRMGYADYDALPIDRRSALAFFLAGQQPKVMCEVLRRKIDEARAASENKSEDFQPSSPSVREMLSPPRPILDPIVRLREWLRVKRYMTLNFDYVLEKKLMLEDLRSTEPPPYGIEQAVAKEQLIKDGDTGGLTRRFPDGQLASTDVYNDKAVGRLFEFALDSADYRAQILHLHGRADRPSSMLLTDNDSNRQYRRDRSVRTTLEQALDVTLTGNPILFVGIGLSEAEITRALRELVSRGRATPHNPVFAIMALEKDGTSGWRNQMAFYSQYGIHLIHAGNPGRWQGLPYFLKVIKALKDRLTHKSWVDRFILEDFTGAPLSNDAFPDDNRARRQPNGAMQQDSGRHVEFSGMSGDRKIFSFLVRKICAARKTPPKPNVIRGWKDYLEMFEAKLFTFSTIEAMRDLYEGSIVHAQQRRLPQTHAEFDADSDKELNISAENHDISDNKDKLLVREMMLWKQEHERGKGAGSVTFEHGWRHKSVACDWKVSTDEWNKGLVQINDTFEVPPLGTAGDQMTKVANRLLKTTSYATFFSPLGTGKGQLLRILSQKLREKKQPYLILNCNFAIEFDSVLSQVLIFIWQFRNKSKFGHTPRYNRLLALGQCLQYFKKINLDPAPTIIISGLERLIDRRGNSVAPELDLLLNKLISNDFSETNFRLIILGADGCESYIRKKMNNISQVPRPNSRKFIAVNWSEISDESAINLLERGFLGHLFRTAQSAADGRINSVEIKDQLSYAAARSTEAIQPNAARSLSIEAVMRVVLDNWHELAFEPSESSPKLVALNRLRAVLDLHILEALSFIGMPTESSVLDHLNTPGGLLDKISRQLPKDRDKKLIQRMERCAAIGRLTKFGLVLTIPAYPNKNGNIPVVPGNQGNAMETQLNQWVDPDKLRIVLHRSAIAEMRERIGVRSGDELLSNSFSMTLALSMPTDLTVASENIQNDLKTTVGRLRGSWRDTVLSEKHKSVAELLAELRRVVNPNSDLVSKFDLSVIRSEALLSQLERSITMMVTDMQVNIRAAAGIIRGFFSAASLVAQMPTKDALGDGELGEFEEHRRRISHLIDRLRQSHRARATALELLAKIKIGGRNNQRNNIVDKLIKEVQSITNEVNQHPALYIGELIWLLNERSVIALLQGDLYEAQRGFREADRLNYVLRTPLPGQAWRRIEINRALLRIERGRIAEARSKLIEIEKKIMLAPAKSEEEDKRTKPLIESYIGLCEHLGGNYTIAERHFSRAISALILTEQQRALAVTYVRKAALLYDLRRTDEANKLAYLGRSTAEAGRQMDILWRARLTEIRGMDAKADSSKIITLLNQAKQYATVMELPRVGIQALRGLAEHHLELGDLESAGIAASEGMTVAMRCGMVLQRIALRTLMGRILLSRGDDSGMYLLRRAISHADRVGYQLQMDRAQQAIIEASARHYN